MPAGAFVLVVLALMAAGAPQSKPEPQPRFDVASIKRNISGVTEKALCDLCVLYGEILRDLPGLAPDHLAPHIWEVGEDPAHAGVRQTRRGETHRQ